MGAQTSTENIEFINPGTKSTKSDDRDDSPCSGDHKVVKGADVSFFETGMTPEKSMNRSSSYGSKRRRTGSCASNGEDPWGWFEDFDPEAASADSGMDDKFAEQTLQRTRSLPTPATEPPAYILESPLSFQQLWYETAGRRPRQPPQERAHFEKLWEKNFQDSSVPYPSSPSKGHIKLRQIRSKGINQQEVLFRGEGPFSNAVSKCFANFSFSSMRLQVPRFRITRLENAEIHAEYLVVVSLDNLTFGIWKRHSDFKQLATQLHNIYESTDHEFKNAILSWKCLLHKQRWFRCLDKDYLSLKCFLLERFMHDLLFESQSPKMINEFLGLT
eukprot:gene11604-24297_t